MLQQFLVIISAIRLICTGAGVHPVQPLPGPGHMADNAKHPGAAAPGVWMTESI
jgi:hypothetical protein